MSTEVGDQRSEVGDDLAMRPPFVVVIDVETTGLDPAKHSVIEIGAVVLDSLDAVAPLEFVAEVRADWWREWDEEAGQVHGITRAVAEDPARLAPARALAMLLEWLLAIGGGRRAILAGMNPGFDLAFLREMARRTEQERALRERIGHRTLDLHSLAFVAARQWDPAWDLANLHTDKIYWLLGMQPEPKPHRALTGARMEAEAFALLLA